MSPDGDSVSLFFSFFFQKTLKKSKKISTCPFIFFLLFSKNRKKTKKDKYLSLYFFPFFFQKTVKKPKKISTCPFIFFLLFSKNRKKTKKDKKPGIGQGLRRLKAKFIDFWPLFERSDPQSQNSGTKTPPSR